MTRQRHVDLGLLLHVGVVACIGGILAVGVLDLVHAFPRWRMVVLVAAAVVVLCMLATALLTSASRTGPAEPVYSWTSPPRGTGWSPGVEPDRRAWVPRSPAVTPPAAAQSGAEAVGHAAGAAPARSPALAGTPTSQGSATSVALRVHRSTSWWEATPSRTQAAGERALPGQPDVPVDLSTYSGVARVVQCPACGDFRVDVRQQDDCFAFTCRHCSHSWQWSTGSPWPPTVVRPRNAGQGPAAGRSAAGSV
jgi:hypothetical protein